MVSDPHPGKVPIDTAPQGLPGHPLAIPPKPAGLGPYPRGFMDVTIPRPPANPVAARIYYPANSTGSMVGPNVTGVPWPVVIFIPGGNNDLGYCNPISEAISSYGFVVINVELGNMYGSPSLRDPTTMALEVGDVIDYVENQTVNASFLLAGFMNKDKVGVSGHSWGGAASGLAMTAAYGDTRIKAGAPISSTPVLNHNYTDTVHVPVGLLSGTSGDNNLSPLFAAGNVPITYVAVVGATHGGVLSYSEYVVAFFKYWLANDTAYDHWLYTDGIMADKTAGTITYSRHIVNLTVSLSPSLPEEDAMVEISTCVTGIIYGVVDHEVDWADGTPLWKSNVTNRTSHIYPSSGTHDVKVRSRDAYETDEVTMGLEVFNLPPRASTGTPANVSVAEDIPLMLNASNSTDTPSDIVGLTFAWDFGDREGSPPSQSPYVNHTYLKSGVYSANLTVTDSDGAAGNATVNVTVVNQLPTAKAQGARTTVEDEEVLFTGVANDTPSDTVRGFTFSWDFGDGNASLWTASPNSRHTYTGAGNYTVTFKAKDDDGSIGNDTFVMAVTNLVPVADISAPVPWDVFAKDEPVQFTGEGRDSASDAPTLEYRWDFGDSNGTGWGPTAGAEHTYTKSGEYTVSMYVKDDNGDIGSSSAPITVENAPPTCSILSPAGGSSFDEDTELEFKATATDTESDQVGLTFSWDLGDGHSGAGPTVEHSYSTEGEMKVRVTARDPEGDETMCEIILVVKNLRPEAGAHIEPMGLIAGGIITFTGWANDTASDSQTLEYSWDLGDGTPLVRNQNGTHVFSKPGTYPVVFSVKDDEGGTDALTFLITVSVNGSGGGGGGGGGDGGPDGDGLSLTPAMGGAIGAVAVLVVFVFTYLLILRRKGRGREDRGRTTGQNVKATKK